MKKIPQSPLGSAKQLMAVVDLILGMRGPMIWSESGDAAAKDKGVSWLNGLVDQIKSDIKYAANEFLQQSQKVRDFQNDRALLKKFLPSVKVILKLIDSISPDSAYRIAHPLMWISKGSSDAAAVDLLDSLRANRGKKLQERADPLSVLAVAAEKFSQSLAGVHGQSPAGHLVVGDPRIMTVRRAISLVRNHHEDGWNAVTATIPGGRADTRHRGAAVYRVTEGIITYALGRPQSDETSERWFKISLDCLRKAVQEERRSLKMAA